MNNVWYHNKDIVLIIEEEFQKQIKKICTKKYQIQVLKLMLN